MRTKCVSFFVFFYLIVISVAHSESESLHQRVARRRPIDLIAMPDNQTLLCLNQIGTVSIIDVLSRKTTHEFAVAKEASDFCLLSEATLAILDRESHELRVYSLLNQSVRLISSTKVSHTPVNLQLSRNRQELFITSLWSHRWTKVDITEIKQPCVKMVVDLPFAPEQQIQLDNDSVFVADAFGGQWAIVDAERGVISRVGELSQSHNISGLAIAANGELFMPHMTLTHEKPTTRFNVHWGDVMLNVVRSIQVDSLLNLDNDISTNLHYLGRPDNATGDPTRIIITKDGRQLVCFAGVGEIGISDVGVNSFDRVSVGSRPEAIATDREQTKVFVASKFDDQVSIVDIKKSKLLGKISLGHSSPLSEAEKGEQLFYDSRLSSDGWFSCHSCHTHGHSNGGLADTFGDEKEGDGKRVLSLLGVGETAPWSWGGGVSELSQQIKKSIATTMRGPVPSDEGIDAIVSYLLQLEAPPSESEARENQNHDAIERGRQVFEREGCSQCHHVGSYTSQDTYDVGIVDQLGNRRFNPPSLRGVSHRHRLFHDNRAGSVRSVISEFGHQISSEVDQTDANDLIRFVESL